MSDTTAEIYAVAPYRQRTWGLRRRILLVFVLGAVAVSAVLAVTTYGLVRSSLLNQREELAERNSAANANRAIGALRGNPATAQPAVEQLNSLGVDRVLIWYGNRFETSNPSLDPNDVPESMRQTVITELKSARMIVQTGDEIHVLVGHPLSTNSAYFEFTSLDDVNSTLNSVRLALIVGSIITALLAVVAGTFASRGAVRPLGAAANAAKAIAGGRLDTRLAETDDPDLSVLSSAFNDMAEALETRIDRDERFASDVSHELRSPLMTLSASVEVMDARREDLPDRARSALDLLKSDVVRFQGLVEDLLEISRFDAGAVKLNLDELLLTEFVQQAVSVSSQPTTPISAEPGTDNLLIQGDRRRLARVIANLVDNARLHGGGDAEITISRVAPSSMPNNTRTTEPPSPSVRAHIAVSDHGPGVPEGERVRIFERFARSGAAGRRADNDGAGLGLAIVEEHVRMHGGAIWVEDRLDQQPGARFVIELDAEEFE